MKVAVSVPDAIFETVERLARQRNVPRSRIFAEALADYVESHSADTVTAKLNELYGREPSQLEQPLARAQSRSIDHEAW